MKAATFLTANALPCALFQSTPPVKAATNASDGLKASLDISIHAAREGGDDGSAEAEDEKHISIHAAREGGDTD